MLCRIRDEAGNITRTLQSIDGHLIMPVQRVPRYRLLLKELVDCCTNEEDKAGLQQALTAVKNTNRVIDDAIATTKARSIILDLEKKYDEDVTLYVTGRKLLKSGLLEKCNRKGQARVIQLLTHFLYHFWKFPTIIILSSLSMYPYGASMNCEVYLALRLIDSSL